MKKNNSLFLATFCYLFFNLALVTSVFADASQITSPNEYKQKYYNSKCRIVRLPSGAIFKIKDIEKKEFLRLLKKHNISISEYNDISFDYSNETNLKEKKFRLLLSELIVKSVENPNLCIEDEQDKLQVGMLRPDDFDYLCREIEKNPTWVSKTHPSPVLKKINTKLVISDLIMFPKKYEGKTIDIKGIVTHEMKEIIISGGERKIILQRFYLSDGLNTILVFWFSKESKRLDLKSGILLASFENKKVGDHWEAKVRRGKFTTTLIPRPVIIGYCEPLDRIKALWVQKIHETLADYQ